MPCWRHRAESLARFMNLSVESVRLTNLAPDLIDSENEAEEDAPDLDGVSVAPALEIEAVPLGGEIDADV